MTVGLLQAGLAPGTVVRPTGPATACKRYSKHPLSGHLESSDAWHYESQFCHGPTRHSRRLGIALTMLNSA